MARQKSTKKHSQAASEVAGLVLLCLGTLVFLALVSYDAGDLPSWIWFSHIAPANDPVHNFIGPTGAVVAGTLYFLIGAASYLVAAVLLGYGGAKLLAVQIRILPRLPWVAAFIASGACLLQLQTHFLLDWKHQFSIAGPGGWLGDALYRYVLKNLVGPVGSTILLLAVYIASLILLTGIRPVALVRRTKQAIRELAEARENRRREKAGLQEQLAIDRKRLEREQRRLEKQLRKSKSSDPSLAATEPDSQEPPVPEPKIFDSNAPVATTEKRGRKEIDEPGLRILADVHFDHYVRPGLDLLNEFDPKSRAVADPEELMAIQNTLIETLAQFGIPVSPGDITRGPTITRFEVYPARGVRVDKIVNLERDLARATRAERMNILAPIPGKDTVGIEIANSTKVMVTLRELLDSGDWHSTKAQIPLALGKDVYGKTIIADLAKMPHCLVAGTTGSGKSVCINSVIASLLYRFTPDELRLIMIDPKVVELQVYNKLPHLVVPVVTDPKKVLLALRWIIDEMEKRYRIFSKVKVRNILGFNAHQQQEIDKEDEPEAADATAGENDTPGGRPPAAAPGEDDIEIPGHMPYIIVIVDELADLMQTAPADVETAIGRITQMARAAGIHMIVATQTPRADVVTGLIKANIPSRIAFQVASKVDSRVILDENGAERLLGQGDMLYLPPGTSRLVRAQGAFVTDTEIGRIVDFVSANAEPVFDAAIHERLSSDSPVEEDVSDEDEELVQKCLEVIRQEKRASTSLLQRRLRLGYTRAARIVDILEQRGILAPGEGARPREILVDLDSYETRV